MNFLKLKICVLSFFIGMTAYAESFKIEDIRVNGLQRLTTDTFFNYLSVKPGETISEKDYASIIKNLYVTGLFEDLNLAKDGNVLIVNVEERPVIGKLNINGNKEIKTKDLIDGLKRVKIGEGETFDPNKITTIRQELLKNYYGRSKFDVILNVSTIDLGNNRVEVNIDVQEGISARIESINIVGNKAFSEEDLLDELTLKGQRWYSFITRSDRYSAEAMNQDLQKIEEFYKERGFVNYKLESVQVSLTEDKKGVYVTVNITEGLPYRIDEITFSETDLFTEPELRGFLPINVGEYYSRKKITESIENLKKALGNKGYAVPTINILPKPDDTRQLVGIHFDITPGRKVNVRRINFKGNYRTNDEVLRRELRQQESAPYNFSKIERSQERIERIRHINNVTRDQVPVPGRFDQIDLVYNMEESSSRNFNIGVGYGSTGGLSYSLGLDTGNLFGTGNDLSFDFSSSEAEDRFSATYTNPYFTDDGVSNTVSVYYNTVDEDELNIGNWTTDSYGVRSRFGIPINEYDSFSVGVGYRNLDINAGSSAPVEIRDFLRKRGNKFDEFTVDLGWTHDTLDRPIFSTQGSLTRLNGEITLPGSDETFYTVSLRNRTYFKLHDKFLFAVRGDLSYGNGYGDTDELPFFERFYAGGLTTVRGYRANTLGPRFQNGNIAGGNLRLTGGVEFILPFTFGKDDETIRTALFADVGNVFDTDAKSPDQGSFSKSELRTSAGVYLLWRSPIGPINFSYARPLNEKPGDEKEQFQFTLGVPL